MCYCISNIENVAVVLLNSQSEILMEIIYSFKPE